MSLYVLLVYKSLLPSGAYLYQVNSVIHTAGQTWTLPPPCMRDMDSPSQRLLLGESTFLTQGVSGWAENTKLEKVEIRAALPLEAVRPAWRFLLQPRCLYIVPPYRI